MNYHDFISDVRLLRSSVQELDEGKLSKAASGAMLGAALLTSNPSDAAVEKPKIVQVANPSDQEIVNIVKTRLQSKTTELDKFIYIIAMRESSCNPFAMGDLKKKYKAYGVLQIRQPMIDDYNRITGGKLTTDDVFPKSKNKADILKAVDNSVLVCKAYLKNYSRSLKIITVKELAGMWNGGPKGSLSDVVLIARMMERGKPDVADNIINYRNSVIGKSLNINNKKLQSELK